MSRTSATRAVCSPRPRFSRLTPAVFTSESICGARVVSFFSRSTRRFFARLMGGAGATAGDGGGGGGGAGGSGADGGDEGGGGPGTGGPVGGPHCCAGAGTGACCGS